MLRSSVFSGLFLAAFVCLFSCSTSKPLEYRGASDLVVENIGFDSSSAKLNVTYYNPNNLGMKLKKADLDIFVDGNFAGHIDQEYKIHIPAKGDFTIPLAVKVDMRNILKNTLSALMTQQVNIRASGHIVLKKFLFPISMPINYESVQHFKIN